VTLSEEGAGDPGDDDGVVGAHHAVSALPGGAV